MAAIAAGALAGLAVDAACDPTLLNCHDGLVNATHSVGEEAKKAGDKAKKWLGVQAPSYSGWKEVKALHKEFDPRTDKDKRRNLFLLVACVVGLVALIAYARGKGDFYLQMAAGFGFAGVAVLELLERVAQKEGVEWKDHGAKIVGTGAVAALGAAYMLGAGNWGVGYATVFLAMAPYLDQVQTEFRR